MPDQKQTIAENIKKVKEDIALAAIQAGKNPEDINLICVTKNFSPQVIDMALDCGIEDIGENRVQELLDKYDCVTPKQWHMIGHLQTNKVKYVVDKVDLIQSVDSLKLLEEIENQSKKINTVSHILLQVNTSGEESKFGTTTQGVWELLDKVQALHHVKVRGLMTIAPLCDTSDAKQLHFDNTNSIYLDIQNQKHHNVTMEYLSMGMSGDFREAILAGSNMVRIGSGIFGDRVHTHAQR